MGKTPANETPLMKQYQSFKDKYPGALLLFRVGDFYETFGEDAITTSRILGITLTKRHNGSSSEIELAGFPHHSLENHLPKLVRAGQRVAICDQLEDPRFAKKLVKRGVTELVSAGVTYQDNVLEGKRNNYLCAIAQPNARQEQFGIAFLDISTGEFFLTEGNKEYTDKLVQSFEPAEILHSKAQKNEFAEWFQDRYNTHILDDWFFQEHFGRDMLTKHFRTTSLKGYGIDELPFGIASAGAILHYLAESQQANLHHITAISRLDEERYMWLDKFTIRNLELLFPQQQNGVALVDILDRTTTPMGARLLRKWVALPLKELSRIEERHSIVQTLLDNEELADKITQLIKPIGDLERLISKVASRRAKPREIVQISKGLKQIANLKTLLQNEDALKKFANQFNICEFIIEKIDKELLPEPKLNTHEGGLIQSEVNTELDELHDLRDNSKNYLDKVLVNAVEETGITSLKIDYNKIYGYFLEVTHTHQHKVPKSWIRKQTLTSAERYITEELKIYEDKILNAEEKINLLEQKIYNELVIAVADFIAPIQQNSKVLGMLDCLGNFALLARRYNYVRPQMISENIVDISEGRHPVIEQQLPPDSPYIPNSIRLDTENQQIIVITGPNMAGKSALLRQVALITLMAQIGCFVPARSAVLGVVDKIFTRVGASDNLAKGESTFMVEMMETASIMHNLSEKSLVLMDEIGRGTSTYDGISIAWAILEYLHQHPKFRPKTLFATHYHELNILAKDFLRIKNYHVSVKEVGSRIVFLRKLAEGGSEHSFGIHVAQMAGMPTPVIQRANVIMKMLEQQRENVPENEENSGNSEKLFKHNVSPKITKENLEKVQQTQVQLFEIAPEPAWERIQSMLKKIDVNALSPIEALLKLNELKNMVK